MKNLDFKKLLVLLIILVIAAVAIFFIIKGVQNNKETKKVIENAEAISIKYYANLTEGYTTPYGGIDILYKNDKTKFTDLNFAVVLNTAIKYTKENGIDTKVSTVALNSLNNKEYGKITDYIAYSGKGIRQAIKELFGTTIEDRTVTSKYGYAYDFYYNKDYDIYLMKRNENKSTIVMEQSMDYKVIETTKKDDKIITTIAIAYVYDDEVSKIYAKDSAGENIVSENSDEFPVDKIDEFDKFKIIVKQTEDNKLVFDSVEKVK